MNLPGTFCEQVPRLVQFLLGTKGTQRLREVVAGYRELISDREVLGGGQCARLLLRCLQPLCAPGEFVGQHPSRRG